ncbi:MAG TPA: S41 family peptidase [Pseudonocardia sp.]|nr:S41 family peptidase [Pseudonocardia sp.]
MPSSYLRFPHLRGTSLTFVAEDDVWLAPLDGGRAYRLSADKAPASNPRLADDGSRVAWTSWRDRSPEVHVADVDGGLSTRLTYWGDPRTLSIGWTDAGEVVAVSGTGQPSYLWTWAHAVPTDGGPTRRLPYGQVGDLAVGPRGTLLLSASISREPAWWKRYRGGTAGKLWWDGAGDGEFVRLLPDLAGNIESPMVLGDRLAFVSDHEGWGNVYSVSIDSALAAATAGAAGDVTAGAAGDAYEVDLRRHTDHGAESGDQPAFYARHATTDGTRIVYQCAGGLWLMESLDEPARRLEIPLGGPRTARAPHQPRASRHLGPAVPDRTGRLSVVEVRGTVHRLVHRDGPARVITARDGVRARLARPLGKDRVVWVSDVTGEDSISIGSLDDVGAEPAVYGSGEVGRVLELAVAPDGARIAVACHDGRLLIMSAETGAVSELAVGADGEVSGLAFSPDSAWLAWSDPHEPGLRRILLARLDDETPVAVAATEPRFYDTSPVFTADGRYLAFLSRRSFDPVYDEHVFDLSFPNGSKPYLVPLSARTPSPFGPSPDGRPAHSSDSGSDGPASDGPASDGSGDTDGPGDTDGSGDSDGAGGSDGEGKPATGERPAEIPAEGVTGPAKEDKSPDGPSKGVPPVVRVDPEGLLERVVALPVAEARYRRLRAGKDCLLWLRSTPTGALGDGLAEGADAPRPVLERYDLVRRRCDPVADHVTAFEVSGDGTRLVVRDRDVLRVLRTDRSGSEAPGDSGGDEFDIDTSRISLTVGPSAEWRQMYDEAGRLMRDHFWTADMSGVDWAGELARYRPLVDAVGSHDDLVDLLWEVQGELGTSHAYVTPPWRGGSGGAPGLLGADLERNDDGEWVVARVLPGESSDPKARSPLSAPGVDVRAGDVLLAVGGRPIDPVRGPAPLLLDTEGKAVELTVRSAASGGGAEGTVRRVVVLPLADDEQLRYQDWVAGRRAFVADRSDGRLGYLHLPDMVANGWAQLHRDLRRETARDGLIIDVRNNGGGHLSQLVIEKLARKVIGWDVVRHGQPTTYPLDAPRGPVVAVADQFSGSDGDIVTTAFQRVGIGPVVGVRTWGGVIGIDNRYRLVDGTRVTQPRYSAWFDHVGWDVENGGVAPDVEVVMTPADHVAGRDPQLATAVDLALAALAERPAAAPPDVSTRPSRARRPLPPRP